jgi:hypothetical protein
MKLTLKSQSLLLHPARYLSPRPGSALTNTGNPGLHGGFAARFQMRSGVSRWTLFSSGYSSRMATTATWTCTRSHSRSARWKPLRHRATSDRCLSNSEKQIPRAMNPPLGMTRGRGFEKGRKLFYSFNPFKYSRSGPPRSGRLRANSTVAFRKPSLSPVSWRLPSKT